jgi:hypothetical protein
MLMMVSMYQTKISGWAKTAQFLDPRLLCWY